MRSFETLSPPKIAKNGTLIIYEDCRYENGVRKVESYEYIPRRDVRMIAERTLMGIPYFLASLVTVVDKRHIAFIHANAHELLHMDIEPNDWSYAK